MSARPMNTARPNLNCLLAGFGIEPMPKGFPIAPPTEGPSPNVAEMVFHAGSTRGKSDPLGVLRVVHAPSVASLLARAERAILARERALARFKAACALSLMGLDFVLLKGLRERRVDRCARLVRESYAEIAALVDGWRDLYLQVSGGSR